MEPGAEHDVTTEACEPNEVARAEAREGEASNEPAATTKSGETEVEGPHEDPGVALRPTTISIGVTAAVLTIVSAFLFDPRATVGVAVGGLLATLNFILFIRLVGAFLSQKGNAAPWAVLAGVKLLGLFAVVYIILKRGDLPPLSLAMGYGSLPIGISVGSLFKARPVQKLG